MEQVIKQDKSIRRLKVYDQTNGHKSVPTLMIKGEWLNSFGFDSGDFIEVKCENEKLIITKIQEEQIPVLIGNVCKHCRVKLKSKTKFCPECGSKLDN